MKILKYNKFNLIQMVPRWLQVATIKGGKFNYLDFYMSDFHDIW